MIEFDKEKIFNGSPIKMLRNKFEELKQDYTKANAIRYAQVYSEMALTDILDCSEYIFTEPMRGCAFYKDLMESCLIPYDRIEEEYDKVDHYLKANQKKMSPTMLTEYTELFGDLERMLTNTCYTRMMYESFHDNTHANDRFYDCFFNREDGVIEESTANSIYKAKGLRLIDAITLGVKKPEKNASSLYKYMVEEALVENPTTPEEYQLNAYTTNVVRRMMKDRYISEAVNNLQNMNLRTLLKGLASEDQSEFLESVIVEHGDPDDIVYSTTENAVNMMFDDEDSHVIFAESDAHEKMDRLACEKAIVDMNESFLSMDAIYGVTAESTSNWDPIVEKICFESASISKIPTDISEQVGMLKGLSEKLAAEYQATYEAYYTADGGPSKVVAMTVNEYIPKKASKLKKKQKDEDPDDDSDEDDEDNDDSDDEDEDNDSSDKGHVESDAEHVAKLQAKKDAQTAKKYAAMNDEDINFNEASEDEEEDDNKKPKSGKATSDAKASPAKKDDGKEADDTEDDSSDEDDDSTDDKEPAKEEPKQDSKDDKEEPEAKEDDKKPSKPVEVEKPQKRSLAQRIQNKALDTNAKVHKKLAQIHRKNIDRKNAAKAVGKIPAGAGGMLKKQISEWEEMDDDKRKEYIIKPGTRKKYFRALKFAIEHYIAFAINPLMNIVLLICQKFSHDKDIRIRNELIHELKTEQKVIDEKIRDMSSDPKMNNEKYKLMRFKDKLDAEIVRVSANSKYV